MNLEEMMEKAYHNYCLYCDMLEDEEDQLYLFYEFLKLLYENRIILKKFHQRY